MSYDLEKTLAYGKKIGADYALILNGELRQYYKKGDKANKYGPYVYGTNLKWQNSSMSCMAYIMRSYKCCYPDVLFIEIGC